VSKCRDCGKPKEVDGYRLCEECSEARYEAQRDYLADQEFELRRERRVFGD